ncbi:MAG: S-layer homology domain-containing protein [Acidimicrobiaceae bacterium]|nr:S-layer homology domain-containing protein [Acidimicrobiaceae bacterium]
MTVTGTGTGTTVSEDGSDSGTDTSGCPRPAAAAPFTDLGEVSAPQRDDIARVYGLGVTEGTTATTFSPADPVTRAQMASFLARLHKAVTGSDAGVVAAPFTDLGEVSAPQRDDIARVYGLGVTEGTTATTFSPADPVTRAQMASFLARYIRQASV